MWRICERQRKENKILNLIDTYLYATEEEVSDVLVITKEFQNTVLKENITEFSDIMMYAKYLERIEINTVVLIDSTTKEEKEIMIEIEGGI